MRAATSNEIQTTKRQFLVIVTGEYLITGYFWVFSALGSLKLLKEEKLGRTFFFTMFIIMLSNSVWEILTGWYADQFKRQLSMWAGFLACCVGFGLMGVAALVPSGNESLTLFIWYAGVSIWALGPALLSGAEEAWLVDRCNFFSTAPPEDVDDVFKKSAAYGVFAKSLGSLLCFLILSPNFIFSTPNPTASTNNDLSKWPFFLFSGIVGVVVSAWLLSISRTLREEYWNHPKYQKDETLFSFLGKGLHELWEKPFLWFAISYVGVMSLNYVLSSTAWAYMTGKAPTSSLLALTDKNRLFGWAIILILAQMAGSGLSKTVSKWVDLIKRRWWRIPVASLLYFVPIVPLLLACGSHYFLYILIVVVFAFQAAHASVFGSLNTIGQLAIKSDERRAVVVSMSSAISSFLMSLVFLFFYVYSSSDTGTHDIYPHIESLWGVSILFILMIACFSYLATSDTRRADKC
jgi:MFS family permease